MRGTTIAATALAVVLTAGGAAVASKVYSPEGHRAAATVQPVGPCKADPDHIGGSTCEIAVGNFGDQVQVLLDNFNAYPVRIKIALYDADGSGHTDTLVRVPAHGSKQVLYDWGTRTQMAFAFYDDYNGKSLGSYVIDKP
jgi:hypothetical protein